MSEKNRDPKGRWRSITIAFRVSPEENDDINRRVRLSGLTKQDYITRRCQERDVVIHGSPRVQKALKKEMEALREALAKVPQPDEELMERYQMVDEVYEGMKEDN